MSTEILKRELKGDATTKRDGEMTLQRVWQPQRIVFGDLTNRVDCFVHVTICILSKLAVGVSY